MSKFGLFKLVRTATTSNLVRPMCVRFMSEFHHEERSQSTLSYDDLYTPQGSFQEDYQQKNKRYTKYLAGSIGFFALSVFTFFDLGCLPYKDLLHQKAENTPCGVEFYEVGKAAMERRSEEFEEAHIDDEKVLTFWRHASSQQVVDGVTDAIFPQIEKLAAENPSTRVIEKEIEVSILAPGNMHQLLYKIKPKKPDQPPPERKKLLLKVPRDSTKEDVKKIVIKTLFGDEKKFDSITIFNQSGKVIFNEKVK